MSDGRAQDPGLASTVTRVPTVVVSTRVQSQPRRRWPQGRGPCAVRDVVARNCADEVMARVIIGHIFDIDGCAGIMCEAALFVARPVVPSRCRTESARRLVDTSHGSALPSALRDTSCMMEAARRYQVDHFTASTSSGGRARTTWSRTHRGTLRRSMPAQSSVCANWRFMQ
jgi:hypothetical protein